MRVAFLLFLSLLLSFPILPACLALGKPTVDYQLPYPGILPDHPLYPLKVLRDKTYDFFLRDSLKKAEFKLLTADKRLFMAIMLFDKGKPALSEQTISEASKYYGEAVLTLYRAQDEGRETEALKSELITSGEKHEEIIRELQENSEETIKSGLQESLEKIVKYQQELQNKTSGQESIKSEE